MGHVSAKKISLDFGWRFIFFFKVINTDWREWSEWSKFNLIETFWFQLIIASFSVSLIMELICIIIFVSQLRTKIPPCQLSSEFWKRRRGQIKKKFWSLFVCVRFLRGGHCQSHEYSCNQRATNTKANGDLPFCPIFPSTFSQFQSIKTQKNKKEKMNKN